MGLDFFESLFDVDGDGEITAADDMLDFMMFNELLKDEEKKASDAKKEEWRIFAEDGSDYDLYPEDYETEEEYNEALREAKTAWRDEVEDGWEYNMDPEDYETEEEYDEALDEAKSKMASARLNAIECGLEPDEYETYDDLVEAIDEAKHPWRSECEYGQEYGVYPEEYETFEEYVKAVRQAARKSEQKEEQTEIEEAEPDEDEINKTIQAIEDDIYGVTFDSKTETASGDKKQNDDFEKNTELAENAGSGDVNDRKKNEQIIPNDYKQKFDEEKAVYRTKLYSSLFAAVVVSILPGLFLAFGLNYLKEATNPDFFLIFFCALLPIGIIIAIFYSAFKGFTDDYDRYANAKDAYSEYLRKAPKEERKRVNKKKAKNAIIVILIIAVITSGLYLYSIRTDLKYNRAVKMAMNGKYEEAIDSFWDILKDDNHKYFDDGYKDARPFIEYCEAHLAYDKNLDYYYDLLLHYYKFGYTTPEQNAVIESFKEKVKAIEREKEKQKESETKKNTESYTGSNSQYPYVGMSESDLLRCSGLSQYSRSMYKDKVYIGGMIEANRRDANVYDYTANGKRYYRITCVEGKVYSINDLVVRLSSGSSSTVTTTRGYYYDSDDDDDYYEDEYDVEDYDDAQEFYYWHRDDFADYEEAEDYFNEYN